jgi:hypothetical protein
MNYFQLVYIPDVAAIARARIKVYIELTIFPPNLLISPFEVESIVILSSRF